MYVCTCVAIALTYVCYEIRMYFVLLQYTYLKFIREIIQENILVITRQSYQDRGSNQENEQWFALRNGRLTSSKFGEIRTS